MINQTLRFEVFKRDGFHCQYCGDCPPNIVLEIDHIIPKSKGGSDIIDNLVTSCFNCNRGKGNRSLSVSPETLKRKLKLLNEQTKQLKAYNNYLYQQERQSQRIINKLNLVFGQYFPNLSMSDNFTNNTVKRFIKHLPTAKLTEALTMACSKFQTVENIKESANNALQYFCGICWNWIKDPETREW